METPKELFTRIENLPEIEQIRAIATTLRAEVTRRDWTVSQSIEFRDWAVAHADTVFAPGFDIANIMGEK